MKIDLTQRLRVLIVDDNPLDRADAKAALLKGSTRRYDFVEASTAAEALRLCHQQPPPDCLVLDLGLPDAGNLDVLEQLPRDADQLLRIPVVVLTAAVALGLNQAAIRAGAQDYVGKAWLRPETLTQAIENAMERLALARISVTERRHAELTRLRILALEQENTQMLEASRLKSLFLANMSHELRTPLNAIIGFAELLGSGTVAVDSPAQVSFLGHISNSGRQLLRLINDVLDLSKVEAGKLDLFPESANLALIFDEVQQILQMEIERKKLRFSATIEPGLNGLVLDVLRLKQVLYNYLSNAIKFTPEGGQISLRAQSDGALRFRIEVEDSGIGIAAHDLPRLFTQYQQLDAGYAKKYQGAGLGLALARRLVHAQQGHVGVRSEPGVGSVFHLVLNRVATAESGHAGAADAGAENAD